MALDLDLQFKLLYVTGILIFYPVPFMRWPLPLAHSLGRTTAKYRWFAAAYLLIAFFLAPLTVFLLSLAGIIALYAAVIPIIVIAVLVVFISLIQKHKPELLPKKYQSWDWLPKFLTSLEPMDKFLNKFSCCKKKKIEKSGEINPAFQKDNEKGEIDVKIS
jgi:sodium-dependent phosphate cotransporter